MNSNKQFLINWLLKKHENIFDGTFGNYTGTEYKIELLKGAQPYHAKSFPIPKVYYIKKLDKGLNKLKSADFKVNA